MRGCFATIAVIACSTGAHGVVPGPSSMAPDWAPPDARWVMHIDVEQARASACCAALLGDAEDNLTLAHDLRDFQNQTGVDPLHDFDHVTLFGSSYKRSETVAIIIAQPRIDEVIENYRAHHDEAWTVFEREGADIHSLKLETRTQYLTVMPWEEGERRLVIFSENLEALEATMARVTDDDPTAPPAADVKRERAPSAERAGVIITGWASELRPVTASEASSESARMIEHLSFVLGEDGAEVFFDLDLRAGSDEGAARLARTAQGVAAWLTARARHVNEGAARTLRTATTIAAREADVTVRVRLKEREVHDVVHAVSSGVRKRAVAGRK